MYKPGDRIYYNNIEGVVIGSVPGSEFVFLMLSKEHDECFPFRTIVNDSLKTGDACFLLIAKGIGFHSFSCRAGHFINEKRFAIVPSSKLSIVQYVPLDNMTVPELTRKRHQYLKLLIAYCRRDQSVERIDSLLKRVLSIQEIIDNL